MKQAASIFLLLTLCLACKPDADNGTEQDKALARVYDVTLYLKDIPQDVLEKARGNDSLALLRVYVNNWVKQQVSLHKAQENLQEDLPELEKKVRDYRNSLLIYEYQRALFAQMLDTTLTQKEIETYYEKNQRNFELKRNIVRLRYVKLATDAENMAKAKKWFLSDEESDRFKLLEYCALHAENTYFDEDTWLSFDDLLKEIPLSDYDQDRFLSTNKFVELKDKDYVYWIYILAYRTRNSISPLELETGRIRSILLNKRKLRLLQEIESNLMQEAEAKNEIEWFID